MNQRTLMAATLTATFVPALPLFDVASIGGGNLLFGQETTVAKTTSLAPAATSELERLRRRRLSCASRLPPNGR